MMGWEAIRQRTSLNQAKGSTPTRWQDATKLLNTGGRVPATVTAEEHPIIAARWHAAYSASDCRRYVYFAPAGYRDLRRRLIWLHHGPGWIKSR